MHNKSREFFFTLVPGRTDRFVIVNHTATSLNYEWNAVRGADSYEIVVTNLENNETAANEVKFGLLLRMLFLFIYIIFILQNSFSIQDNCRDAS